MAREDFGKSKPRRKKFDKDKKPRKDSRKSFKKGSDKGYKKENRGPRKEFDRKPRRFTSKPRKDREEINIKKLGINGEGIGYIKKKVIFVQNALPLEMVEVEIDKKTQTYMLGHVTAYKKLISKKGS